MWTNARFGVAMDSGLLPVVLPTDGHGQVSISTLDTRYARTDRPRPDGAFAACLNEPKLGAQAAELPNGWLGGRMPTT